MADTKINLGLVIIVIAVIVAIISISYFSKDTNLIIRTNKTIENSTNITNTNLTNTIKNIATYTIEINNFKFSQNNLTIQKGDTVIWVNKDSSVHTITSDNGNELGSTSLIKNETYSHKFQFDGTYNYHCEFHPDMKGKIIVEL